MIDLALKVLASYLVGSVLGSSIVGRLTGSRDIREEGSGNAGGTNALRTRGARFALGVIIIDIGKGVVSVLLFARWALPGLEPAAIDPGWTVAACGAAAVVGHCYPIWYGFRGGKGAATLVGIMAVLAPVVLAPVLGVWVLALILTGFVGLATILGAAAAPLYFLLAPGYGLAHPLFAFSVAMALFILFTHRSNVTRMLAGDEHRWEKAMILKRG